TAAGRTSTQRAGGAIRSLRDEHPGGNRAGDHGLSGRQTGITGIFSQQEIIMDAPEQQRLKRILTDTRNIALVGASNRPERASYQVMEYLQQQGYRVYPVNPQLAGAVILGETCVSGLEDLDQPVQLVNVFRRGE